MWLRLDRVLLHTTGETADDNSIFYLKSTYGLLLFVNPTSFSQSGGI